MSRKNAVIVHLLFWLGLASVVFALSTFLFTVDGEIQISCGTVAEVLVGDGNVDVGGSTSREYEQACQEEARGWGGIAIGTFLLGGVLVAGATVWARRIYRENYRRPGVTSNGASTS